MPVTMLIFSGAPSEKSVRTEREIQRFGLFSWFRLALDELIRPSGVLLGRAATPKVPFRK
jgi:hypothetical protein